MIVALIILFFVMLILIWGHFGLPEKRLPMPPDPQPEQIMPDAEPFEYNGHGDGKNVCVMLIHGFEGSPFTMRGLGEFLNKMGYHVVAPLLPGHGTKKEDFIQTRYEHWYAKVEDVYLQYRPRFRYFFVIGLSMGGNLTLKLAESFHDYYRPTGVVTMSAPVFFNGFFNGKILIKDWRLLISGIIKQFIKFMPKPRIIVNMEALSPWRGYKDSYTLPCLHSLKLNAGRVRAHLYKINVPILLIHALNDRTVNAENLVYIYNHVRSRERSAYSFSFEDDVSTRHLLTTHHKSQARAFYYISRFIEDAMVDFERTLPKEKPSWIDRLRLWWES